jgi:hypothetical protein
MERDDAKHYPVIATLASLGSYPLLHPVKICRISRKEEISMPFRRGGFALTPPSVLLFGISLVLAVLAFLVHYSHMSVPIINSSRVFDVLTIAYIVLMVGVLFRRV